MVFKHNESFWDFGGTGIIFLLLQLSNGSERGRRRQRQKIEGRGRHRETKLWKDIETKRQSERQRDEKA